MKKTWSHIYFIGPYNETIATRVARAIDKALCIEKKQGRALLVNNYSSWTIDLFAERERTVEIARNVIAQMVSEDDEISRAEPRISTKGEIITFS